MKAPLTKKLERKEPGRKVPSSSYQAKRNLEGMNLKEKKELGRKEPGGKKPGCMNVPSLDDHSMIIQ